MNIIFSARQAVLWGIANTDTVIRMLECNDNKRAQEGGERKKNNTRLQKPRRISTKEIRYKINYRLEGISKSGSFVVLNCVHNYFENL